MRRAARRRPAPPSRADRARQRRAAPRARGAVGVVRDAEPARPPAAARHLHERFAAEVGLRGDHGGEGGPPVEIGRPPDGRARHGGVDRLHRRDPSLSVEARDEEARHVDPGDLRERPEEPPPVDRPPPAQQALEERAEDLLRLPEDEQIEQVRQRLRIERGADAPPDDQREALVSLAGERGDARAAQDRRRVPVVLLAGEGEGDEVEGPQRRPALHRAAFEAGRKGALGAHVGEGVEERVDELKPRLLIPTKYESG